MWPSRQALIIPADAEAGIVPRENSTQALVLITKRPRPHITTNPAYCFTCMRDAIFAGQLPHQCHVEHDKAEILRHAR